MLRINFKKRIDSGRSRLNLKRPHVNHVNIDAPHNGLIGPIVCPTIYIYMGLVGMLYAEKRICYSFSFKTHLLVTIKNSIRSVSARKKMIKLAY